MASESGLTSISGLAQAMNINTDSEKSTQCQAKVTIIHLLTCTSGETWTLMRVEKCNNRQMHLIVLVLGALKRSSYVRNFHKKYLEFLNLNCYVKPLKVE